jgi:hypothetical protein
MEQMQKIMEKNDKSRRLKYKKERFLERKAEFLVRKHLKTQLKVMN